MGNRFNTTTTTRLIVGSLLLLSPAYAAAAGLGKLSVLSALGQPLKAEIDIVAMQPNERDLLTARIAGPDAFRQAGVEYGAVVPHLRADIEQRADGRAVLTLKSQQPVNEPFVDVLVELDSASGRLVRQYTFLLDPIGYKGPEPAVIAPAAVAQSKPVAAPPADAGGAASAAPPAPQPVSPPAPAVSRNASSSPALPADSADAGAATYQVKQGDTLAGIAEAHRPQDVSLQRMLVALHRANADAFIKNNMNLVRAGAILRVPEAAELDGVSQEEAVRVVNSQARAFNEYRASLAEAVAAAPATAQDGQQRAAGRITTMVDEKPAAGATPKDELRLSRATQGSGATTAAAPDGDDAASRSKALDEANGRVAELERNLKDLQKLLDLKNAQLATLQQQAQAPTSAGEQAAPANAPPAEAKTEPALTTDKAETAPAGEAGGAAPAADATKPSASEAAPAQSGFEPTPAADAAKAVAKPAKKKKAAPPPPPPEPSFIDSLLEDPVLLAGGLGALIALLGGFVWRRKRSAAMDNSLVGMTTTDSSSVFGTTGGRSVDTGASALQTDFSQSGIGSIDTEEVDPVAEADVYMAYGRDAQAEEILKEALQKDPSRQAVRLKLLEIYAARKDLKAFETTAEEIRAATGGEGGDWEKTVSLGRSIDPNNPMYGGTQAAGAEPAAGTVAAATAATARAVEVPDATTQPSPLLDFDLNLDGNETAAAPDIALDAGTSQALDLDLDLDLGKATAASPAAEEPADFSPSGTLIMDAATKQAVSELGAAGNGIDFDLDAPTVEQKGAESAPAIDLDFNLDEPKSVPAVDLSGLSLDLNAGADAGGDANWQEVATKLDLAKAYEEMGDKDGARELLNEVLKEGDSTQQAQARTMLEAIR